MTRFSAFGDHDGVGLAALVKAGEVSPEELLEESIHRIEEINPTIGAVVSERYDRARSELDSLADGPFRGVPFLLKDLLTAIEGETLEMGCEMYRGWVAPQSSELARRYRATGAVVVGRTNTPELGLRPTTEPLTKGPTRNPWALDRTAGGSSGGTAAAVATRMVPLAGGGDGGGSIRIPASCCGIFGLKPTRGRTPVGPLETELWEGCAVEHVLTRSVRDSAVMLDAVSGPLLGDVHYLPPPEVSFAEQLEKDPGVLRIAVSYEGILPGSASADCVQAVEDAVSLLEELGHEVVRDAPAVDGLAMAKAYVVMIAAQTAAGIRAAEKRVGRRARRGDFEELTWLAATLGEAVSAADYVEAVSTLQQLSRQVLEFCHQYDVVLNPTLAEAPPPLGFSDLTGLRAFGSRLATRLPLGAVLKSDRVIEQVARDEFAFVPWTPVYNATGQPSMSVPLWWNRQSLPVGTMFTGRFGDEATLFRLAAQLENARPWSSRKPPTCS